MDDRVSWWTLVNSIVLSENEEQIQEFLLGFQSAGKTPQHLYDDLISIHARAIYRLGAEESSSEEPEKLLKGVERLLFRWLDGFPECFENNPLVLRHMQRFSQSPHVSASLRDKISSVREIQASKNRKIDRHQSLRMDPRLVLGGVDLGTVVLSNLARDLTAYEHHLLRSIEHTEIFSPTRRSASFTVGTNTYAKWFQGVRSWISTYILSAENVEAAAKAFVRSVQLASGLFELRNYNGALEVVTALCSFPVGRLLRCKSLVPTRELDLLDDLHSRLSPEDDFAAIKELHRTSPVPYVPYLGLILSELRFLDETASPLANRRSRARNSDEELLNPRKITCAGQQSLHLFRSLRKSFSFHTTLGQGTSEPTELWSDEKLLNASERLEPSKKNWKPGSLTSTRELEEARQRGSSFNNVPLTGREPFELGARGLSATDRDRLLQDSVVSSWSKNDIIMDHRTPLRENVFYVVSGAVRIIRVFSGHKYSTTVNMGGFFGVLPAVLGRKDPSIALASGAVQTAAIPIQSLMKVLSEDARLAQRFFMAMALTVSRQLKDMNAQHVLDLHAGTALSGKVTNFDVDAFLRANHIDSIATKDDEHPDSHRDVNLQEVCDVPVTDRIVGSWPCQIERDSLDLNGRLFITTNYLCIYSRFFNFESNSKLRLRDIQKVEMPETGHMKVISCTGQTLVASFKRHHCSEVVEGLSKQLASLGYEVATSNASLFVLLSAPDAEEKAVRRATSDSRMHQRMTAKTKSAQSLRTLNNSDLITQDDSVIADQPSPGASDSHGNWSIARPTSGETSGSALTGFPDFEMTASHWDILLRGAKTLKFEKQDVITVEGAKDQRIYQVISGKCIISKQANPLDAPTASEMMVHYTGSVEIATLYPGDIFGESQFLDPRAAASATVTAATSATILVLEGYFLNTLFRQAAHQALASHFFRFLLSLVAERLLRSGRSSQFHIPTPKSFHDSSSSSDEETLFPSSHRSDLDDPMSGDLDDLAGSGALTDECASSPAVGEESAVRRFSNADKEQSVVDQNMDATDSSGGDLSSRAVSFDATDDSSDVVGKPVGLFDLIGTEEWADDRSIPASPKKTPLPSPTSPTSGSKRSSARKSSSKLPSIRRSRKPARDSNTDLDRSNGGRVPPVAFTVPENPDAANYPSWESQRRLSIGSNTQTSFAPVTLEALMRDLIPTSEAGADYKVAEIVILTHRYFMSSEDLFSQLAQHFRQVSKDFKSKPLKKKKKAVTQNSETEVTLVRFMNILRKWLVDRYRCDFFRNEKLTQMFKAFCEEVKALNSTAITAMAGTLLQQMEKLRRQAENYQHELDRGQACGFLDAASAQDLVKLKDLSVVEIAEALTLIEFEVFKNITPDEFLQKNFTKSETSPLLHTCIRRFNQVSLWVTTCILSEEDPKERASLMTKFIDVAEHMREINNFSGIVQITSGLNNSPISRLKNSWKLVSDRKWETLRSLNTLMSPDQNQAQYRRVFGESSLPAIPFQAVLLRDLTFIEDGNRTFVDEEDTLINLRKLELLSKVVQSVLKMQHITYTYRVEPVVHLWFQDPQPCITDPMEHYRISQKLEPRESHAPQRKGSNPGVRRKKSVSSIRQKTLRKLTVEDASDQELQSSVSPLSRRSRKGKSSFQNKGKMLDDLVEENEELHKKVQSLEQQNLLLAKELAQLKAASGAGSTLLQEIALLKDRVAKIEQPSTP
mmetsp:Transcript_15871/g.47673  ORF Transcript_15871/g.47673 Transcript_15871/m.47673 type:complete len:1703 (-) Transcript_15871:102-5210(-)